MRLPPPSRGWLAALLLLTALPVQAASKPTLEERLVGLEKQSWEAWKNRNGKFFESFLADDHLDIGPGGIGDKAQVVAGVNSPACVVTSYSLDRFRFTQLNDGTAALVYRAQQDTQCGGKPVPSPTWVTSVYAKRHGRWVNVLFQKTQAPAQ
jgi:hypothetical protein